MFTVSQDVCDKLPVIGEGMVVVSEDSATAAARCLAEFSKDQQYYKYKSGCNERTGMISWL
jgi:hypothetical protein